MKLKLSTLVAFFMAIMLTTSLISGCQAAEPTKTQTATVTKTQTITTDPERDPRTLRIDGPNLGWPQPYTGSLRGQAYLYTSFIFDTLVWKDAYGVVPMLATGWSVSEDDKTWTFELEPEAKFTDGEPVTANDVKFSFEYIKDYPSRFVQLDVVESVNVINDHTIEINLEEPFAPFLTDIAGLAPIMPEHIWSEVTEPAEFTAPESVIGSGPFLLDSFDSTTGTYIFEANKDYYLGSPVIDRLIYSSVSNPHLALLNNDIDVAQQQTYREAQELKQNPDYELKEGPGLFITRLYFNFDLPEFNEVPLRQAFYTAIDREAVIEKDLDGGGTPGNPGYISPDSEWYNPDVPKYDFDPDRARQILDDNGFTDSTGDGIREYNGEPLNYELIVDGGRLGKAQIIADNLEKIGVEITIKSVDRSTLFDHIQGGTFELALSGHGSMGGDPVMMANFVSPDVEIGTTPVVTRQGGSPWGNNDFDEIFIKQLSEMDYEKRHEMVGEMQQIFAEELPTLPILYLKISVGWNPDSLNGWFFTEGGVGPSVPTAQNKLVFINGSWGR